MSGTRESIGGELSNQFKLERQIDTKWTTSNYVFMQQTKFIKRISHNCINCAFLKTKLTFFFLCKIDLILGIKVGYSIIDRFSFLSDVFLLDF